MEAVARKDAVPKTLNQPNPAPAARRKRPACALHCLQEQSSCVVQLLRAALIGCTMLSNQQNRDNCLMLSKVHLHVLGCRRVSV